MNDPTRREQSARDVAARLNDLIGYPPESIDGVPTADVVAVPDVARPDEPAPFGEMRNQLRTPYVKRLPVETTAEVYYQQMEAAPPAAYGRGTGFLVGEPFGDDEAGNVLYAAFWRCGTTGKYFGEYMTKAEFFGIAKTFANTSKGA